jgi:hypothetical protein
MMRHLIAWLMFHTVCRLGHDLGFYYEHKPCRRCKRIWLLQG